MTFSPLGATGPVGCIGCIGPLGSLAQCPQCGSRDIARDTETEVSRCTACGWNNEREAARNQEKRIKNGELRQPAQKKTSIEKNYNIIEVTLGNGQSAIWEADKGEWDDYAYAGMVFIIKKNGAWVGIYNMSHVISIVVK